MDTGGTEQSVRIRGVCCIEVINIMSGSTDGIVFFKSKLAQTSLRGAFKSQNLMIISGFSRFMVSLNFDNK